MGQRVGDRGELGSLLSSNPAVLPIKSILPVFWASPCLGDVPEPTTVMSIDEDIPTEDDDEEDDKPPPPIVDEKVVVDADADADAAADAIKMM